jgi:hypothetical protein
MCQTHAGQPRFSPDGNAIVTADYGGTVRLWSALPFEAIDGGAR